LTADQALGRRGEDIAHRYLRSKGLQIMARNFRLPNGSGEIDIVARLAETLIFVEVKTRRSAAYGAPERAVDPEKERHIIRAARSYVLRCGADWSLVRFDIISIVLTSPPSITHYEDAFFPQRTI
jgi:putative endonuclease